MSSFGVLADVAQSVEHILGKDEVTSSNLVISSTQIGSFLTSLFVFCGVLLCNAPQNARRNMRLRRAWGCVVCTRLTNTQACLFGFAASRLLSVYMVFGVAYIAHYSWIGALSMSKPCKKGTVSVPFALWPTGPMGWITGSRPRDRCGWRRCRGRPRKNRSPWCRSRRCLHRTRRRPSSRRKRRGLPSGRVLHIGIADQR